MTPCTTGCDTASSDDGQQSQLPCWPCHEGAVGKPCVCAHVCMGVHVCVHCARMHECVHMCSLVCAYVHVLHVGACVYVCAYVCMCVRACMRVCVCWGCLARRVCGSYGDGGCTDRGHTQLLLDSTSHCAVIRQNSKADQTGVQTRVRGQVGSRRPACGRGRAHDKRTDTATTGEPRTARPCLCGRHPALPGARGGTAAAGEAHAGTGVGGGG